MATNATTQPRSTDARAASLASTSFVIADDARAVREPQLGDDGLLGVGRGMDRRDRQVPGGTEDAEGRRYGNRPCDRPLAPDDEEERDRQIAKHGQNGQTDGPTRPSAGPL